MTCANCDNDCEQGRACPARRTQPQQSPGNPWAVIGAIAVTSASLALLGWSLQ